MKRTGSESPWTNRQQPPSSPPGQLRELYRHHEHLQQGQHPLVFVKRRAASAVEGDVRKQRQLRVVQPTVPDYNNLLVD